MQRSNVVAIIQPYVPAYRRALFDELASQLNEVGLELEVWHSDPSANTATKSDAITGPWSRKIPIKRWRVRGINFSWQPVRRQARRVACVISGLASANLSTYELAIDPQVKLMLWGHGKNFTVENNGIDDRLESFLAQRAVHLFTYTDEGRDHLQASLGPGAQITVVQNSTNVSGIRTHLSRMSEVDRARVRSKFQIGNGPAALFVGSFEPSKRLPFLYEACDLIIEQVPSFQLLLGGDGKDREEVIAAAKQRPYVVVVGRLTETELAELASAIDFIAMPGRVGLVAVDSLATGVPIVTTDWPYHAPEYAYLNESNSVTTANSPEAYALAVVDLLKDPERRRAIAEQAWADGSSFSVEHAARNLTAGILAGIGRTA